MEKLIEEKEQDLGQEEVVMVDVLGGSFNKWWKRNSMDREEGTRYNEELAESQRGNEVEGGDDGRLKGKVKDFRWEKGSKVIYFG